MKTIKRLNSIFAYGILNAMETRQKTAALGPLWVALGAMLWGTETLWRVFLNKQFASDVLVLYEHGYCLLFSLPALWFFRHKLKDISARTWWFLLGSGVLGSAVGTVFFTLSLRTVNLSVANVLLNIQPVFSAIWARYLLGEHFKPGFFGWAAVAVMAGMVLSMEKLTWEILPFHGALWLVFATAMCWGFATVAGRGVNVGMDYRVATPLRFLIGGIAMGAVVALDGHLNGHFLTLAPFAHWQTHRDFIVLSVFAGVLPLFLYFKGLSQTPAAVASFFEMFQILAALCITWGFFGHTLALHQIVAGVVLLAAVFCINRIQQPTAAVLTLL